MVSSKGNFVAITDNNELAGMNQYEENKLHMGKVLRTKLSIVVITNPN